jgi:hypothetical protein
MSDYTQEIGQTYETLFPYASIEEVSKEDQVRP